MINVSANFIADHRAYKSVGGEVIIARDACDGHARGQAVKRNVQPRVAGSFFNDHTRDGEAGGRVARRKRTAGGVDVRVVGPELARSITRIGTLAVRGELEPFDGQARIRQSFERQHAGFAVPLLVVDLPSRYVSPAAGTNT